MGAVLYEMITGARPFGGKSQISVASASLENEPEPISVLQPLTPPELEHIVTTCLAKNADDRFQTAHDIALQLKWIVHNKTATVPSAEGSTVLYSFMLFPQVASRIGLGSRLPVRFFSKCLRMALIAVGRIRKPVVQPRLSNKGEAWPLV